MRDLVSCYSDYAVQISEASSCTSYTNTSTSSSCIPLPPQNSSSSLLIPSIQIAVTCLYKTILSTKKSLLITVTWCKNNISQGLQINSGDDPSTAFRLNTNSRFFRNKKRGSKSFEINGSKFDVFWDLSSATYNHGPEPVQGYYVLVMVDSELGLLLGDMAAQEAAMKKLKILNRASKFSLVSRREYFSGNTLYATKAQFCENGVSHDVVIRCSGENDGLKYPVLTVFIDKKMVIRVKRLQWNFRGNQTIFVDGLLVDLMWDVHHWFNDHSNPSPAGGYAVFMFRTRSGMDSRLWLEEKLVKKEDDKLEFSLLIYACKS